MNQEEIKDYIEMRTQSSNKTHEAVIRDLQRSLDTYGKKQEEMYLILKNHIEQVTPMLKQFERYTIGKSIAITTFKAIAWIGGLIITLGGAYIVIKQFLISIVK